MRSAEDTARITDPVTLELKDEESVLAGIGGDLERFYREELLPAKLRGYVAYARSRSWLTDIEVLYRTVLAIVRPGGCCEADGRHLGEFGVAMTDRGVASAVPEKPAAIEAGFTRGQADGERGIVRHDHTAEDAAPLS